MRTRHDKGASLTAVDLLHTPCRFDDGDCCPATCKRTFIDNSCSPSLFNCRDPNGNKDTVPPTLYGLPMPEDEVFEKTFSSLSQSSGEPCVLPGKCSDQAAAWHLAIREVFQKPVQRCPSLPQQCLRILSAACHNAQVSLVLDRGNFHSVVIMVC